MILFFGVIIPKWLMNASWSIAILFGTFLERHNMWPNMDPWTPYLSPQYFKNTRTYGSILEHIIVHIWEFEILKMAVTRTEFFIFNVGNCELSKFEHVFFYLGVWKHGNEKWNLGKCKFENNTSYSLKMKTCKLTNWQLVNWTLEIWKFKNPQNPSTYR